MSAVFDRAAISIARVSAERTLDALGLLEARTDNRWLELCAQVDPQRIVRGLTRERIEGPDREASAELDKRYPRNEPNSATIPWETLALRAQRYAANRALTVGSTAAGGYLVEAINTDSAAQSLLSLLILGRLGATGISSTANLNLPRISGSSTPYWLASETAPVTESDLTIGQQSFTPHTIGGYTEISRLLLLQSSVGAADLFATDLARRIARAIEAAAFSGPGTGGAPHGILNASGVTSASGASATVSTLTTAVGNIGDALDPDTNCGWAASRSAALTLRARYENSGSIPCWRGPATVGELIDYPAAATSGIAGSTAIFGAWKFLVLTDFGGGLGVALNPYGSSVSGGAGDAFNFQKAVVGLRAFAVVDVGLVWPAAFTVLSSVS